MAFGAGSWGISCALLAVNSVMTIIIAGIAGWAFNRSVEHVLCMTDFQDNVEGAAVASHFLPLALVASVVGMGSILAGIYHLRVWRTDTLAAAVSVALVAWLLSLLAAGVALKEIHVGGPRSSKLKVVETFTVLLPLFEFYYLLSLHAAVLFNGREGQGTPHATDSQTQTPITLPELPDVVVEEGLDHFMGSI
ncbi:hypothetical protein KC19_1G058000 [Ceratodon purpureus]|uniref:Uncharacterized protein n=1 Tax=Ceratodon purpureus TaxID=3225 RepID=A0A8T0J2Z0_CERPU|nr:hypothetical protein KC19_1G058000 [Ceratodon purpureus]